MSRLLLVLLLGATPQTDPVQKPNEPSPPLASSSVSLGTAGRCMAAKTPAESEAERVARIRQEGTVVERAILEYKLAEEAKRNAKEAIARRGEAPTPPARAKPCTIMARK